MQTSPQSANANLQISRGGAHGFIVNSVNSAWAFHADIILPSRMGFVFKMDLDLRENDSLTVSGDGGTLDICAFDRG